MNSFNVMEGVGHAIQLAVAPVFLLSAIALILNVLTNRLGRVTDRVRLLEGQLEKAQPLRTETIIRAEVAILSKRAKLIDYAITLSTVTSLLVCGVIATLFLGAYLQFAIDVTVMTLFVAAMLSLVAALLCLLREILKATFNLIDQTSRDGK